MSVMITAKEDSPQRKKINPKKFAMWIAIGSIIMMFGGLTSGYIVRKSQGDWDNIKLPVEFYISTVVILLSSATLMMALRSFKQRKMKLHRNMVSLTFLLGIAFTLLQYFGFKELLHGMKWANNVSFQYLIVIVLVHALHILGGIVTLFVLFLQTYSKRIKTYSSNALEIAATYWHFVDILWIYLFIFFLTNRS
jgi:cytochrome c oxidase subunit 3